MNLIIDGHSFLNVSVSVVLNLLSRNSKTGGSSTYYYKDLFSQDQYVLKEASRLTYRDFSINYLKSLITPFKDSLDGVYFVFDGKGNWRTDQILEFNEDDSPSDLVDEIDYKGHRPVKEDQIYLFFNYFISKVIPELEEKCNIVSMQLNGLEGDDIIAWLEHELPGKTAIWSTDRDLAQLVKGGDDYTVLLAPKQMSKFKKIFTSSDFLDNKKSSDELDDFFSLDDSVFTGNTNSQLINTLKAKGYEHLTIDTSTFLIDKVLAGDPSDNIPRVHNMSPKKREKAVTQIMESFTTPVEDILTNPQALLDIRDIVAPISKIEEDDDKKRMASHILLNCIVMRLAHDSFPKELALELVKQFPKPTPKFKYNTFKDIQKVLA